MYNISIPEISREELERRYEHIKPIVEIDGQKYFLREYTIDELYKISYIWNRYEDKREPVDMSIYEQYVKEFECIHKYGHPTLFKPSIAEVLAQITKTDEKWAVAFEIIAAPQTALDFSKKTVEFDNGFHSSVVRLYFRTNR